MIDPDPPTLSTPVRLPCGKIIPNRLVKAPMYESLASFGGGAPNDTLFKLYNAWGKGGWGMIVTGNVMLDPEHQGLGQDVLAPTADTLPEFTRWARSIKSCGESPPLAIVQLNHPGRQSMRCMVRAPWTPSIAPSSMPFNPTEGWVSDLAYAVAFGTPREMTHRDIIHVIERFRVSAVRLHSAGWDGVQVHCAHGYLLSQFLSPRTNHRSDEYGGSPEARIRIVLEIIGAIRRTVPSDFCLGVKLNSQDYIRDGLTEDEALQHIQLIHKHGGVDFIEISGGNYESPDFLAAGDVNSEPFFQQFATRAVLALANDSNAPLIMLTGNMRSRAQCVGAVRNGGAQLCGIGRASAVDPNFASKLLDANVPDEEAVVPKYTVTGVELFRLLPVKAVGATGDTLWHCFMFARIARGQELDVRLGFWTLFIHHLWGSVDRRTIQTMLGLLGVALVVYYTRNSH